MTVVKSKPYNIGVSLSEYHFSYDNDKLIGISKLNDSSVFVPLDPSSSEFSEIKSDDKSVRAFNIAKFNKEGVTDTVDVANDEVLTSYYNTQKKKLDNKQFIEEESESPIAAVPIKRERTVPDRVLSYPLDIDINQDHLKINRYTYKRPSSDVQASRPPRETDDGYVAGDSVKGTSYGKYQGGVILPMPKVSDSNGAQWGESDLDVFTLGIAGAGARVGGKLVDDLSNLLTLRTGFRDGENLLENDRSFADFVESSDFAKNRGFSGQALTNLGIAGGGLAASTLARQVGINIGADEFLARSGGRILNPNAELLFQGPVLRDFAFKFLMIARSKKEGEMIRRIIRWFKTGAAPVFNDKSLLQTPSIFQLTYGRGQNSSDYFLPTVNKFNEMALRNITVDYAPDGFWSAYQDSQPVAVVVNLQFTELRPVYRQDQDYAAKQNDTSVGY